MRRIKQCLFVYILVIAIWLSSGYIFASECKPELSLYSYGAVAMDGETGRVLYGKNENEELPMASTTKIMTLILALEYGNLDDYTTVSSYASKMPKVRLGVREGEQYLLSDILYSMILESHNDSAVIVAEHIAGSVENFSNMMNEKAREIGLTHTYFITPNGLDAEDKVGCHHTTAKELAMIMQYCTKMSPKKEQFIEICQTRSHRFTDREGKRSFEVHNKNALFDQMSGVVAGKTGFTGKAGYCYVCIVERDGRSIVIALLACGWPNHKTYKWQDTKALVDFVEKNYAKVNLVSPDEAFANVIVQMGTEDYISPYITETMDILIADWDCVQLEEQIDKSIKPPLLKNQVIGLLNIYVNDEWIKSVEIYCDKRVERTDFDYYIKHVLTDFLM